MDKLMLKRINIAYQTKQFNNPKNAKVQNSKANTTAASVPHTPPGLLPFALTTCTPGLYLVNSLSAHATPLSSTSTALVPTHALHASEFRQCRLSESIRGNHPPSPSDSPHSGFGHLKRSRKCVSRWRLQSLAVEKWRAQMPTRQNRSARRWAVCDSGW